MDLMGTLFSTGALVAILTDAANELRLLAQRAPTHSFVERETMSLSDEPDMISDPKPKTITEFRLLQNPKINIAAVMGTSFETIGAERELWQLQYLFFFVLYGSQSLRESLASGSPKQVYDRYIRTFTFRFERHINGMHNNDVTSADRVLLGSQDPLEFVVSQVQCIQMAYTGSV